MWRHIKSILLASLCWSPLCTVQYWKTQENVSLLIIQFIPQYLYHNWVTRISAHTHTLTILRSGMMCRSQGEWRPPGGTYRRFTVVEIISHKYFSIIYTHVEGGYLNWCHPVSMVTVITTNSPISLRHHTRYVGLVANICLDPWLGGRINPSPSRRSIKPGLTRETVKVTVRCALDAFGGCLNVFIWYVTICHAKVIITN